jgi:hypothetical protein
MPGPKRVKPLRVAILVSDREPLTRDGRAGPIELEAVGIRRPMCQHVPRAGRTGEPRRLSEPRELFHVIVQPSSSSASTLAPVRGIVGVDSRRKHK